MLFCCDHNIVLPWVDGLHTETLLFAFISANLIDMQQQGSSTTLTETTAMTADTNIQVNFLLKIIMCMYIYTFICIYATSMHICIS